MSCAGHILESRQQAILQKKIVAVIQNVTVEELQAMMQFLKEYRERKK
jgi:hypothetical protein